MVVLTGNVVKISIERPVADQILTGREARKRHGECCDEQELQAWVALLHTGWLVASGTSLNDWHQDFPPAKWNKFRLNQVSDRTYDKRSRECKYNFSS